MNNRTVKERQTPSGTGQEEAEMYSLGTSAHVAGKLRLLGHIVAMSLSLNYLCSHLTVHQRLERYSQRTPTFLHPPRTSNPEDNRVRPRL